MGLAQEPGCKNRTTLYLIMYFLKSILQISNKEKIYNCC